MLLLHLFALAMALVTAPTAPSPSIDCPLFERSFADQRLRVQAVYTYPHGGQARVVGCPNAVFDIDIAPQARQSPAGEKLARFIATYVSRGVSGMVDFDADVTFERKVEGQYLGRLIVRRVLRIRRPSAE